MRWDYVQSFIKNDEVLQRLISQLQAGDTSHKWFSLEGDVLKYKGRVVIPRQSELTTKLLREYHDSLVGGHAGELKTYQRLVGEWFWFGMRKDVANYVQHCHVCQQNKTTTLSPHGTPPTSTISGKGMGRHINGFCGGIAEIIRVGLYLSSG